MRKAHAGGCFALLLGCILLTSTTAVAETPEKVLAGEVKSETGAIRFTGGTLFQSPSDFFDNYELASHALQGKGVSKRAADEFVDRLRQSIEALKRNTRGRRAPDIGKTDPLARQASLLQVEKRNNQFYRFDVYTGPPPTIIKFAELDQCQRLNDKCYICSDGIIRCLIAAVMSDPDQ